MEARRYIKMDRKKTNKMEKQKISISIDKQIVKKLKQEVKKGKYANLSFAIEYLCRRSLS